MIEVKTGQRWKRNDTGEALNIGKPTAGHNVWYCVEAGAGCVSAQWLNQRATLAYDPDEGEAPEVGSRWRREYDDKEVTVERIGRVGKEVGVFLSDSSGPPDAWLFCAFRYNGGFTRIPDEPTDLERYEAERRKVEAFWDGVTQADIDADPDNPNRVTEQAIAVGDVFVSRGVHGTVAKVTRVDPERPLTVGIRNQFSDDSWSGEFNYPAMRLLNPEWYERRKAHCVSLRPICIVDGCGQAGVMPANGTEHVCATCNAVGSCVRLLGGEVAAFVKRQKPTRDELLEHWMSLRPDDLHEGGWRRVGVAHISGDADMDDGLHTIESVVYVAEDIADGIQRGSLWSFVRLYREEARRGKWWAK